MPDAIEITTVSLVWDPAALFVMAEFLCHEREVIDINTDWVSHSASNACVNMRIYIYIYIYHYILFTIS